MRYTYTTMLLALSLLAIQNTAVSCKKSATIIDEPVDTIPVPPPKPFDINSIEDDYSSIASADLVYQWGSHNVHDPCVIKEGVYYYCYNTDVAYGATIKPGIQIRRSKDLIDWQFYGLGVQWHPGTGGKLHPATGRCTKQGTLGAVCGQGRE